MLSDIEVQHLAPTMFQHNEHEQHPHGDRRHRKEVDRHQLADVVVEKRLPRLSWWPTECSENSGDGTLGDFDAEHLQFTVNSRRTPQRIGSHDPFDQPTYLGSSRRPAAWSSVHAGEACPELARALPLPPDDRVGLYVDQGSAPAVPNQGQPDPEQVIEGSQHRSLTLSLEGCELKAECGILYRNGCITAHQESTESKNRPKEAWHVSRLFVFILSQVNLLQAD
jgi:hypothetical protein